MPRKLRLLLEQRNGTLRNVAQVLFTGHDASLYLVPYATRGQYFYGQHTLPVGGGDSQIKFREHTAAAARPKISIHESGNVHVYANDSPKAGPVVIPRLTDLRGEHIASVQWDHVNLLPVHSRRTRTTGEQWDIAFGMPDDIEGGVLCIFANGVENLFLTGHVHFAHKVASAGCGDVWFGFSAFADDPLGTGDEGGVSVLAGFDARKSPNEDQTLLFLRGL